MKLGLLVIFVWKSLNLDTSGKDYNASLTSLIDIPYL